MSAVTPAILSQIPQVIDPSTIAPVLHRLLTNSFPGYSSKIRGIFTVACDDQGRVTRQIPGFWPLFPKRNQCVRPIQMGKP
jgi:hypothetical protein